MGITKEQEEHLKKMIEIDETKTNYVCLKCKYRFIGLKEVRKHVSDKQHYEFANLKTEGVLGFV